MLLDILAGRNGGHGKIYGEFMLNGNPMSIERLGSRVGYVRKDYRLHKYISVEQTLSFHYLLRSKDLSTHYLSTKVSECY
jgi:ABC-type multidrug transport system ATPase subunit